MGVRDHFLGRCKRPGHHHECAPDQVMECFEKQIPGIAHGTVTVILSDEVAEVITIVLMELIPMAVGRTALCSRQVFRKTSLVEISPSMRCS